MSRVRIIQCCLLLAALVGVAAYGQRTIRPGKMKREQSDASVAAARQSTGWLVPDSGAVTVSGFAKPLSSLYESMYVTNNSDSTMTALKLSLDYRDTSGRQLHQRSDTATVMLPPGETRRIELRSFDRQQTCCYVNSVRPRSRSRQTLFTVRVHVDSVRYKIKK